MAKNWLLKILIFAALWIVGGYFFGEFGGSVGGIGSMLYIGKTLLGISLSSEGGDVVNMIVAFIITAAAYYIVAEIITFLLMKIFGRR